ITNVVLDQDFLDFMYKLESIILLLFEKYNDLGPDILLYIHKSLLCNLSLLESFNILINIVDQKLYISAKNNKLTDEVKGTSSFHENLKVMKKDIKKIENYTSIKKSSIPMEPILELNQLQIWAYLKNAEE
ncbi:4750_t:CDS:2, partial [Dentiscutata erythropus]